MTAASGTDLPAANGPTHRTRGAVSAVDPASSPTSDGVGEGRGPADIGFLVVGEWCTRCGDQNYDAVTRVCLTCTYPEHPCSRAFLDTRPAVSRTLAVAEQTVEKARERR